MEKGESDVLERSIADEFRIILGLKIF